MEGVREHTALDCTRSSFVLKLIGSQDLRHMFSKTCFTGEKPVTGGSECIFQSDSDEKGENM